MHVYITTLRVQTHWSHCLTVSSDSIPQVIGSEREKQTKKTKASGFLFSGTKNTLGKHSQPPSNVQSDSYNNINATWLLKLMEQSSKWTLASLISMHSSVNTLSWPLAFDFFSLVPAGELSLVVFFLVFFCEVSSSSSSSSSSSESD